LYFLPLPHGHGSLRPSFDLWFIKTSVNSCILYFLPVYAGVR
jgi:hypothetical protein